MKQLKLIIHGNVQGVFYRDEAKKKADELNLKGYALNKDDGTVEIKAIGEEKALKKLLAWCKSGSKHAKVGKIDVHLSDPDEKLTDFQTK